MINWAHNISLARSAPRANVAALIGKSKSVLLSSAVAALLLLSSGQSALAAAETKTPSVTETAFEAELQIETTKQQLTYLIQVW